MSIEQVIAEERAKFENENSFANVMILGHTGAGKSSLINYIFGSKIAEVGDIKPQTRGFGVFLGRKFGKSINIIDSEGYELGSDAVTFVSNVEKFQKEIENGGVEGCVGGIHVIWYCISATKERIEDIDIDSIKLLKQKFKNFFVIMTKCDEDDENLTIQKSYESLLGMKVYGVSINLDDNETDINTLINDSASSITDDDIRKAFAASQERNLEAKENEAHKIILGYTAGCALAGVNPVPFVSDTMLITPAQVAMLVQVGHIYGVDMSSSTLKSLAAETLASNLGKALAGNLIKLVPGIGSVIGGAINASVAGIITYGMGFGYSKYCKYEYKNILNGQASSMNIVNDILDTMKYYVDNTSWGDIKQQIKDIKPI